LGTSTAVKLVFMKLIIINQRNTGNVTTVLATHFANSKYLEDLELKNLSNLDVIDLRSTGIYYGNLVP
jgi:hypothetical protein